MASKPPQRKRVYCPHCDEYVSRSLFYQHKQLYYDESKLEWITDTVASAQLQPEVNFEFMPETLREEQVSDNEGQSTFDGTYSDTLFEQPFSDTSSINDDNSDFTNDCTIMEDIELDYEIVSDENLENMNENESEDNLDVHQRKVIRVFLLFLFLWQSIFRVSNAAISLMLSFMVKFFSLAATCLNLDSLNNIASVFPASIYRAKKYLDRQQDSFQKYVTCSSCHSLYSYTDSTEVDSNGKKTSKFCSYIRYPAHVQARMRSPCGCQLLKTVRSSKGSEYLAPFQTYCFKSVIKSMEELLNRPSVAQLCEKWRSRTAVSGKLRDVYDGQIWQNFRCDFNGLPFLELPNSYLLMLNCDWFQPFRHTTFSVGVLYLALENLPREVRFRRENILVVGIIPGPSEPSMNINSFLEPMIKDLQALWTGVTVTINNKPTVIRAAIACLSCDVPAARKVGGFVSYRGKHGCNKCLKEFTVAQFGEYPDYSGFVKSDWEPRSCALHLWYAYKHRAAKTEVERKSIEATHGARYSTLFELPYYHPISSCIIDPMHCLFLGISKHFLKVWVSNKILSPDQLHSIQNKVDKFNCPPDIGRIPYKLASNFSGLKADQWKSWTMYFSLFALKGVLPHRDYDCWLMFVKVCTKICRREIAVSELDEIDCGIQNFCEKFEQLYGKTSLTPNMHLAAHITDCIRDHGPVYAFWLYAFERMNGILGSFQTSNHDITVQLMRKVASMQNSSLHMWPEDLQSEFSSLFQARYKESGSLLETNAHQNETSEVKPLPPILEKSFEEHEIAKVKELLHSLHPSGRVLRLYRSTQALLFSDSVKLATKSSRYSNSSKILIQNKLYEINQFVHCSVLVEDSENNRTYKYWLVHCSPYMEHPCKPWFGYPTQVWASVCSGYDFFLLQQIDSRVVYVETTISFGRIIGEDKVLVITPISFFFNL